LPAVRGLRVVLLVVTGAVFVLCVVTLTGFRTFLHLHTIPSESMTPTVPLGSEIVSMSVDGRNVERGDIILFTNPQESTAPVNELIKRVVAVGGDTVELTDGKLVVNGAPVTEPYLRAGTPTTAMGSVHEGEKVTVPAATVYVLGDNRTNSKDSRWFGPVRADAVRSKVLLVTSAPVGVLLLVATGLSAVLFAILFLWDLRDRAAARSRQARETAPPPW
jgi:signal peptidase I